jgi:hypothetical protein
MQLGTRWPVGSPTPERLPDAVVAAVRQVESELDVPHRTDGRFSESSVTGGVGPTTWRWTLTWLEGRPVVELDDGTVIRVDHAGNVEITSGD